MDFGKTVKNSLVKNIVTKLLWAENDIFKVYYIQNKSVTQNTVFKKYFLLHVVQSKVHICLRSMPVDRNVVCSFVHLSVTMFETKEW